MDDPQYKEMITTSFNQASSGYDTPAMRFFDLSAEHLVNSLVLNGDETVLDVATGTGKTALLLARQLPKGRVIGMDLSDGMLQQARRKAADQNLNNIKFECMDMDRIDCTDYQFDGACCSFGTFFFSDMQKTLEKIIQKINPGGFLAITSFLDGSFRPQSDLCLNRFKEFGIELPEHYTWERLDHPDKHRDLLHKVGLKDIHSQTQQMGYALENPDQWWDLVYNSGFRSFLNQLSNTEKEQYKLEHLAEIQALQVKQGLYLNVDVIFTRGRK